ncbi:MAG: ATP-binding protein [Wenzhouxiangella sp.]
MPLYLRIFLAFWAVIVLSLAAVVLVNLELEADRQAATATDQRIHRFADGLSRRAQAVLDQGGPSALARWSREDQRRPRRISVLVVDQAGNELLDRRLPRRMRMPVRDWLDGNDTAEGLDLPYPAHAIAHPVHGRFLLLLVPPPRPVVMRLIGPLGPWGLLLVGAIISGLICLWLARSITRPVKELRRAGEALGQGTLSARVSRPFSDRHDEFGEMARDFNEMADRIERLVTEQRQLLRDVSHELRSPLTRLQMALSLAERTSSDDERAQRLGQMQGEIQRLEDLIGQVLAYSRLRGSLELPAEKVNLVELAGELVSRVKVEAEVGRIEISLSAQGPVEIDGSREWLGRALENALRNAIRHSPSGGKIKLRLDRPEPRWVEMSVADQGPGVPEDQLEAIFEPFVRLTPERSEGSAGGGVGLAIARAAAEQHGGRVRAEHVKPSGLRVIFSLPCRPA